MEKSNDPVATVQRLCEAAEYAFKQVGEGEEARGHLGIQGHNAMLLLKDALDAAKAQLPLLQQLKEELTARRECDAMAPCDHRDVDFAAAPPHCRVCKALWDRRGARVLFERLERAERLIAEMRTADFDDLIDDQRPRRRT